MRIYRKTFTNCSDLPLLNFIKILTKGDLRQLYSDKDNWLMKPDLEAIWDDIFMEYTELSNDTQNTHIFNLIKDIHFLKNKIDLIDLIIDTLTRVDDLSKFQPMIKDLKSLAGVYLPFTEGSLLKDLITTKNKAKSYLMKYKELILEYKSLAEVEQAKATEMDYMEQVSFLKSSDGLGVSFDIKNISVMEYIAFTKQLKSKV